MTRENYNKFISLKKAEVGEKYFIQTVLSDENTLWPFCKFRVNGTEFIEKFETDLKKNMHHRGIYIDVFPYDNATTSVSEFLIKKILNIIFKSSANRNRKPNDYSVRGWLKYIIGNISHVILPIEKLHQIKTFIEKDCDYIEIGYDTPFFNYKNCRFNKSDIFPLSEIKFEGTLVPCPSKTKESLTVMYGQRFMELPPKHLRKTHYFSIKANDDYIR